MSRHILPHDTDGAAVLVDRLKPIRPMRMRCVVVAEYLSEGPPEQVVEALAGLVRRAAQSAESGYLSAVESVTAALADPELLPYETRAALYAAAKRAGYGFISRLFFDVSPATNSEADKRKQRAPERAITPRGRPLTLGERKSLARSHRRDLIVHLLRDPHPEVVRVLLGNPHLTETDVLAIVSRRPAAGEALAVVAAHQRWATRYAIKLALVQNPHTPLHLAIRLATTLRAGSLHAVVADPKLAGSLREHARTLLAQRSRGEDAG